MASLSILKDRLKSLDFTKLIQESAVATKSDLIEYQKGQMLRGLTAEGKLIGKYKNKDYARKKANMNPLAGYGNVDLRLKGEFHRGIHIKFFSSSFQFTSSDFKFEKLTDQYTDKIWGLSPPFAAEYSRLYLSEQMNRRIKNHIHGV